MDANDEYAKDRVKMETRSEQRLRRLRCWVMNVLVRGSDRRRDYARLR